MNRDTLADTPRPFAKRSLGQNFLQDPNIAGKIVDSLHIAPDDAVVEIGPGRGALTGAIRARGPGHLTVIEKDVDLAAELGRTWPDLDVVQADALRFDWAGLPAGRKVIGNLPYNIASPLIWDIVSRCRFSMAVFMVQYEVARRIAAGPGGKEYGVLGIWVQSFARPTLLFKVGPNAFRPRPKVDSAVVRLVPEEGARPFEPLQLAQTLRICFRQRRKQLGTILRDLLAEDVIKWFDSEGLDLKARPEEVSPAQYQTLSNVLGNRFPS
jgi:16S rRNA (adenine1518-N6/adenine1519-N6)-dimethyltransferase